MKRQKDERKCDVRLEQMRSDTRKLRDHLQAVHGIGLGRSGHIDTRVPLTQSDQEGRKQQGLVEEGGAGGPAGGSGLGYRHCQWSECGSVRH